MVEPKGKTANVVNRSTAAAEGDDDRLSGPATKKIERTAIHSRLAPESSITRVLADHHDDHHHNACKRIAFIRASRETNQRRSDDTDDEPPLVLCRSHGGLRGDQWIVEGYGGPRPTSLAADVARGRRRSRPRRPARDASRCDPVFRTRRHSRDRDERDPRRSLHLHGLGESARRGRAFVRPTAARSPSRRVPSCLGMGHVEKVILRFDDRWWPRSPSGYLRWYDEEPSWGEWLDLTDGSGAPAVAGLIAADAIDRWHRGRTDRKSPRSPPTRRAMGGRRQRTLITAAPFTRSAARSASASPARSNG